MLRIVAFSFILSGPELPRRIEDPGTMEAVFPSIWNGDWF